MGDPVLAAFADPLLTADQERRVVLSLLHGMNFESGLGGGIALRSTSATRISRCRIGVTRRGNDGGNRARRDGGIACYTGGYPVIEDSKIAYNLSEGDGGGIAIDQFDPFLSPGTNAFGIQTIAMVPRQPIALNGTWLHHNRAGEDGGGLYATGAANPVIKGGLISSNEAGENGGGIRVSYATRTGLWPGWLGAGQRRSRPGAGGAR